jgi:NAD+ synthase
MSLNLNSPEQTVGKIVEFLKSTFAQQNKKNVVIAVSGGIDSALSLALLAQALPKEQIFTLFLPYKSQSVEDAQTIANFLSIPKQNQHTINIETIVDAAAQLVPLSSEDRHRKGNLMARARMMLVFDTAKRLDALVCGTENKSEHFLGYYTRFGDAASDIEPIAHLYKTNVRELAEYLAFPSQFLTKSPSAGLWQGQTDEQEMGFSYEVADQVLHQLVDEHKQPEQIVLRDVKSEIVAAVIEQVKNNRFKFHVPYVLE